MINITEEEKNKWRSTSIEKSLILSFPDMSLVFTNDDIVFESLSITESINEENALAFTGCIASEMSISISEPVQDLRGQYCEVTISVDNEQPLPLFKGYVDSQDNLNQLDAITNITAYDILVTKINAVDVTSWYNSITYPISVKAFRDSFFNYLNVPQENTVLVNDGLYLSEKTIKDATILGESIIKYICQMNAVFGQISRYGEFKYVKLDKIVEGLYPAEDLYPSDDLYPAQENAKELIGQNRYITLNYEPFKTEAITRVSIRDQEGLEQGGAGTSTDNQLVIADNPLIWSVNMQTAATNIYSVVDGRQFTPANIECIGYPYIECGDVILLHTNKHIVRTYILKRTLKGIQALFDDYDSESDRLQPTYQQSLSTSISANGKNILKIQADIVEINEVVAKKATIADLDAAKARIGNLEVANVTITGSLNALRGDFDTLSAKSITTDNFHSQLITADMVSSGVISASKITSGTLNVNRLNVTSWGSGTSNARWSILSWCTGVERSGSQLKVHYRDFAFLNCGYTAERTDTI